MTICTMPHSKPTAEPGGILGLFGPRTQAISGVFSSLPSRFIHKSLAIRPMSKVKIKTTATTATTTTTTNSKALTLELKIACKG